MPASPAAFPKPIFLTTSQLGLGWFPFFVSFFPLPKQETIPFWTVASPDGPAKTKEPQQVNSWPLTSS